MDIVTLGNETAEKILLGKTKPVEEITDEVVSFTRNMIETMILGHGVGLAAPQVNDDRRIFVVKLADEEPMVFINPEILQTSLEESVYEEGCLSIPGVYDKVTRPAQVRVQAWNENGKPFIIDAEGLLATVVQHEYDHLQGKLFIDHLNERRRKKIMKAYNKLQGHNL